MAGSGCSSRRSTSPPSSSCRSAASTAPPDGVNPLGENGGSDKEVTKKALYKANTSYQFTPHFLGYFTYSQGERRGGANGVPTEGYFAASPAFLFFPARHGGQLRTGAEGAPLRQAGVLGRRLPHRLAQSAGERLHAGRGLPRGGERQRARSRTGWTSRAATGSPARSPSAPPTAGTEPS